MPPEPLPPWDHRRDFFKERKRGRPESFGPYVGSRWGHGYGSSSWGCNEFRRPPPGHGKEVGWHLYAGNSFPEFVPARSNYKTLDNESYQTSGSQGYGRYGRNSRENGRLYYQKHCRSHSWETAVLPNCPGRLSNASHQRSAVHALTYNHPHSYSVDSWDQSHLKDQHYKNGGFNDLGKCQRFEKESSAGSISWKHLKRTRPGSLSARGSVFSHSSNYKSIGVDSNELKTKLHLQNVMPAQLGRDDIVASTTFAVPTEDMSSQKKSHLGWGEGLAKYEKKKVEGPDDIVMNTDTIDCSNAKAAHFHSSNFSDKSPIITDLSDCLSPASLSFGCSSSPGLREKQFPKAVNVDETSDKTGSVSLLFQNHFEGVAFNLEDIDLASITRLSSAIVEILQSDDLNSVCSGFVRPSALNKLLGWKVNILKALEMIESETDFLENELKLLSRESLGCCPPPIATSSLQVESPVKLHEIASASHYIIRNAPLQPESPVDLITKSKANDKDKNVECPCTEKPKSIESLGKAVFPPDPATHLEFSETRELHEPLKFGVKSPVCNIHESVSDDVSYSIVNKSCATVSTFINIHCDREDNVCNSILASNREAAIRASKELDTLLPINQGEIRAANLFCLNDPSVIKEKFAMRKHSLRLKERVLTLKFRACQHLWKKDMHLLSIRKCRAKSQKKYDSSFRTVHNGCQKHRSSIRCSSPDKLLSYSEVRLYRNTLKMPSLILDKREKMISRFITCNCLVEDPCAVERERSMINLWTAEEKEIFIDKLATLGKNFRKIASFLDQKTTADCVEFYYKNHKSIDFEKTKKKEVFTQQGKSCSTNTYMVTSGKRWNRERNAVSLDILGAASAIAANTDATMDIQQKCMPKYLIGTSRDYKNTMADNAILAGSNLEFSDNERENVAADVLAGISGSLSSEAMSSCITSSVDPPEGYQECKGQKAGLSSRRAVTPEVTQNVDDCTCWDESCRVMDSADWSDEEKIIFVQALSSYGKNFRTISRCLRTRSRDQCKVFFSKARKCLGLDMMCPAPISVDSPVRCDANANGIGTEGACMVESASALWEKKPGSRMGVDLPISDLKVNHCESDLVETMELDSKDIERRSENLVFDDGQDMKKPELLFDGNNNTANGSCNKSDTMLDLENVVTSSDAKVGGYETVGTSFLCKSVCDHGLLAKSNSQVCTETVGIINVEHAKAEVEQGILLPERISNYKQAEIDAASTCGLNSSIQETDSEPRALPGTKISSGVARHQLETAFDTSLPSEVQNGDCQRHQLPSLSDADKSCRNGDFKLFGQILTHSKRQLKPNSCAKEKEDEGVQDSKLSAKSFHCLHRNSSPSSFGPNNLSATESIPASYGSWDGNKIHTCLPSLTDSAISVAKDPPAFHNCTSSKREGQLVHDAVVKNKVENYPLLSSQEGGDVQPSMQKRNGVPAGGAVVREGLGDGSSKTVVAIKLHYRRSKQFKAGPIVMEDSLRGKQD